MLSSSSNGGMIRTCCCNQTCFSACSSPQRRRVTMMLPLIYTHLTAAAVFIAACLVWLVPETIGAARQWANGARQEAVVQDRGSLAVLLWLQWIGLALNLA